MPKISPIAEYLRVNNAISKRDKFGCHFVSPEGLYLGRLTKSVVNNYKVISLETFGEGFKKLYTKSIAIGQQFAYIKNNASPIGLSVIPVATYMRQIFVDFIEKKSFLKDQEKKLTNNLELIAIEENTNVGIYDTNKPFEFETKVTKAETEKLTKLKFEHTIN